MIKPIFSVLAVSAALTLSLAGCSGEEKGTSSTGSISPFVSLQPEALTSTVNRAGSEPNIAASDLSLKLVSEDGSINRTFSSVNDFPTDEKFKVGRYTLSAYYGENGVEGFEKPYFYDEQTFSVKSDETASVDLTAVLANSMVTVSYTDAFRNYMSNFNAILHSAGGDYNFYGPTETRPIYLNPGSVTLQVRVVKNNGTEARLEVATFTAQPRHHYRFTVDVNNGEVGNHTLVVSLDEQLGQEDVIIDLSDQILNAPAPEIKTEGFTSGDVIDAIGATAPADGLKMNVVARGGIRSVKLSTESEYLTSQAWPAEVDLAAADEIMQSRLESLGLSTLGIWNRPDQMGVIDFTDVVSNIKFSPYIQNNASKFTVVVTDRQGKTSEPATFTINTIQATLNLSNPSELPIGGSTLSLDVEFNGADLQKNVIFQYRNSRGTFDPLTIESVTDNGNNTYRVTLNVPVISSDLIIRAKYNDTESSTITVKHSVPEFTIEADNRNVFSTKAIIEVKCATADPEAIARNPYVRISTDGGATWAGASFTVNGAFITINRLTHNTTYTVTVRSNETFCKEPVSFKTEESKRFENGSMEMWTREDGQSAYWWRSYPGRGTSTKWGTMNLLTTSEGGSSTNIFNRNGCAYSAISGTISTIMGDNQGGYMGQGALIRTVGWGGGNSAAAISGNMGTCQHITPGELYVGYFDTNTKQPVYGTEWTSRPSGMKFYYKYEPKSSDDRAYAEISILDSEGKTISTQNTELSSQADWKEISFTLEYPLNTAKAKTLIVKFKSSNIVRDDKQFINTTYLTPPPGANLSDGTYMGSQLYIDEIELIY